MKLIEVELTSVSPLLQHKMSEDELFALLAPKSVRKKDIEPKTPREIAEKFAYKTESGIYYVPAEYLMGAFIHIASDYKQKNSTRKSMKSIASGIVRPCEEKFLLFDWNGCPLSKCEVDIRKGTNHQKGAIILCRPRFDQWKLKAQFEIDDVLIAPKTFHEMLNDAGKRAGIGSFRVSRGGYFGQFRVTKFVEVDPNIK